jgi:hypothetical protein
MAKLQNDRQGTQVSQTLEYSYTEQLIEVVFK